jgi:hypothetical protein
MMPEPMTPADLDLRDFPYMPLDVVRLRDSESSVICSGEEFRAAVLLWCAAWHQVPAASLPDDDRLLANLAGFGRDVESWKAVREGALRGFILCDDGRLYHPVIAEKANEADTKRKGYSDKMAKARAALADRRASTTEAATETMTETIIDSNKGHKGREGKGREKEEVKRAKARDYVFDGGIVKLDRKNFDDWTQSYPNIDLRGELTARDAWLSSDRASDADRRNWFISTSKYLANRNMEARAKAAALSPIARPLTPSGQPWPDGII